MYITAQRVRSGSRIGINTFYYRHGDEDLAGVSWERPDVALVADSRPGALYAEHIEVQPWSNVVLAFLDVVARDGTAPQTIRRALEAVAERTDRTDTPTVHCIGGVGIRYEPTREVSGSSAQAELAELAKSVLSLLHNPTPPAPPRALRVKVVDLGHSLAFMLDDDSAQRIRTLLPHGWQPYTVQIAREVRDELEQAHGVVATHLLGLLTSLPERELARLGGAVFVDADTGQPVSRWPMHTPG